MTNYDDFLDDNNYSDGMTPPHYNAGNAGIIPMDDDRPGWLTTPTEFCTCPTSTRPRSDLNNICPKCKKARASSFPKASRRKPRAMPRRNTEEIIARIVYDEDRDVELPE